MEKDKTLISEGVCCFVADIIKLAGGLYSRVKFMVKWQSFAFDVHLIKESKTHRCDKCAQEGECAANS